MNIQWYIKGAWDSCAPNSVPFIPRIGESVQFKEKVYLIKDIIHAVEHKAWVCRIYLEQR